MASKIAAINHYRPMIEYGKTVDWKDVAEYIAISTGLNPSEIIAVLLELHQAIIYFNRRGHGVRLEGLGTYLPQVNYKGQFDISYRPDGALKRALNNKFSADLINKQHIGMSSEQVVALWNSEHPEDPVT